jgi:putative tryptophan/tyrosine transport system substrate-binding protein
MASGAGLAMKRRGFIAASLGGLAIGWPIGGFSQQPNQVRRIGALLTGPDPVARELEKLGWVDGRNIHIERRTHDGDRDRIMASAVELVRLSPEVIVATSPIEAKALRQETSSIPIVFIVGVDPVSQGIIDSFAHPGGNITGCSSFDFSVGGKWVQSLKEIAPNVKRVGIVFNPQTAPYIESIVESVASAAGPLQVQLSTIPVRDISELERSIVSLAKQPDNAVIFPPDVFLSAKIQAINALVTEYRLPAIHSVPAFAKFGGLLAYGPDLLDNYRRAANLVDRILKGAKPADLPIEQPNKFLLVINLKTAKALGLDVSPTLLARADEVIE